MDSVFELYATIGIKMDEFERGLNSAKEKFDGFSEKLSKAGETMSNVGGTLTKGITLPLAGLGTAAGKMYMGFEDSMAKVNTIADTSQVPLDELQRAILALSNQTGISSSEIANNVYDAISAGQKTGDAVNFVKNSTKLAKAGFAEAGDALDILTTIMNAYGLEADKVTDVSDMLIQTQNLGKTTVGQLASAMGKVIPTAKAQGVELDDLSGAYAVMTANGVATAETTTYLNSMLNELGKQGTTASKAFAAGTEHIKAGGLSMKEAMDSGWELTDVLSVLDEQAFLTGTSISNMFGSAEAGKAAAVLWDNAEKLNESVEKMRESTGSTEIAFEKLQTKSVVIEKAINQLKNTIIDLGGALMQTLAPMIESASEKIASFAEWFSGLSEETKNFIVTIGLVAAAVGPVLIVIGKIITALTTIGGAISTVVGVVTSGITSIIGIGSKLMGGIQSLFALIMAHPVVAVVTAIIAAVVLLWNNCEEFRNAVGAIWEAIVGFFTGAWESIKAAWGNTREFFASIWEGIQGVFQGVAEFFGGIFQAAAELVQTVWSAIVDFFSGIWQGIQSVFTTVAEVLGGFFQAAAEAVQAAWSAVVEFFSGIWQGIQNVFSVVAEVLGGFFSAAWEAIQSAWSAVAEFFSGIWEGIKAVFEPVAEVLGGFFKAAWEAVQGAWEAAKEFFGGIADGIHAAFEAVTQFLGDAFFAAWEIISGAWGAAVEFFSGIWDGITGVFGAVAEWFGDIFSKAWDAITAVWDGVTEFFSGVWEDIKGVFSDVWEAFKNIGSNIVSGIKDGVMGAWDSFWGWLSGKVGGIIDGVKSMLGIHSPSKVFAGIGQNMVLGLADGWNDEYSGIKRQIERGLDFGPASVRLNTNGVGYAGGAAPGYAQNPVMRGGDTYNFYSPEALDPVSAAREMKKARQQLALGYV